MNQVSQSRIVGGPDREISSAFALRHAEPLIPLHEDGPPIHAPALVFDLTVGHICNLLTTMVLGIWGDWSLMPTGSKVPASAAWASYICIITEWIIMATNLDCMCPTVMNWYFRWGLQFYIGGFVETTQEDSGAWFFHDDYGPRIWIDIKSMLLIFRIIFALSPWWWIFFRIVARAVINILRNRAEPELALQYLILTAGLTVEIVLLCWFFSIPFLPYLFKWAQWDRGLWYGHLPLLLAMLAAWVLVVVIGLREDLQYFIPVQW